MYCNVLFFFGKLILGTIKFFAFLVLWIFVPLFLGVTAIGFFTLGESLGTRMFGFVPAIAAYAMVGYMVTSREQ